jgi:uncharacterized protein
MPTATQSSRQTALVTGASNGIGLELAKQFAAHGFNLVITARHLDALEALAGQIEGKHGVKVTVIAGDLTDPETPQRLFDAVAAENIHVDYLINNAGFGLGGEFVDTDLTRELEMIQVNIVALINLTKLFLPAMLKKNSGGIMNVASTAAFQAGPLMSVYYASKAFVLSFSEALDEELHKSKVRVTCLCPGSTATNFAETALLSNSNLFAKGAVATPEEVAVYGFKAMMRGERVAVVGARNKAMVLAERFVPRRLVNRLARAAQENR